MGCTFDHFQPGCRLTFSEPLHTIHEQQKQDFGQKHDFAPTRNLEIAFENRFSFLPSKNSFLLRRKGRCEQTDFRNEIYAYKRTRDRLD